MEYKGKSLQFIISPGRFPEDRHREKYLQIYQCWYDVWAATFKELDGINNLTSDAFTRQDLVGAIFVDGQCKAMSLFRYADATQPTFKSDSYFENWNDTHREKLCKEGKNILVCSYFTIHPTARKDFLGFAMRDLLMGLTTEVIVQSNCAAMTGAMRKNRNAHEIAYEWGAEAIAYDIPSGHGDATVDLVGFYKSQVLQAKAQKEFSSVVKQMWDNKILICEDRPNPFNQNQPTAVLKAA